MPNASRISEADEGGVRCNLRFEGILSRLDDALRPESSLLVLRAFWLEDFIDFDSFFLLEDLLIITLPCSIVDPYLLVYQYDCI